MSSYPSGADENSKAEEKQQLVQLDDQLRWGSNRYEPISEIGVGAYGVVYKAKDLQNENGFVAMKCLRVENTEQGMPLSMVREIALLRQLETKEHPNVIKLLDICLGRKTTHETQLMLVFEHIDQDLDVYLKKLPEDGLEPKAIKSIMQQLLRGLDFLHSMRVLHRDLKPQNILITHTGTVKIADFGLARILSFEMALTAVVVTLWYRSPEVLLQDSYSSPVDLWSVGCIFAELYNRRPLFRGSGDINQLKKIFEFIGRPSELEWPADVAIPISSFPSQSSRPVHHFVPRMDALAADLFLKLLSFDPALRPNAKNALEHEYFKVNPVVEGSGSASTPEENTSCVAQHHRMPYTQRMRGDEKPHSGETCHESLMSTAEASSKLTCGVENLSKEEQNTLNSGRRRTFGDPLPLNVKDGASGELHTSDSCLESAFLTPPSDLASTSSESESSTSSSAEASQHQPVGEPPNDIHDSCQAHLSPSSTQYHDFNKGNEVLKRTHKDFDAQSRMSWTGDCNSSPDGGSLGVIADFNPTDKPVFKTPAYQILDSGKYVPFSNFAGSTSEDQDLQGSHASASVDSSFAFNMKEST